MSNTKTCSRCSQIKSFNDFGNHAGHSDGKSSRCLNCDRIARSEYRKRQSANIKSQQADNYQRNRAKRIESTRLYLLDTEHRKKKNESGKRWRAKNKPLMASYQRSRRAKILNNGIYLITNKQLNRLYGKPCIYCGSNLLIEIDHVISIARGGNHGIGNLASACMKCNRSKQELFIMEWRIKNLRK